MSQKLIIKRTPVTLDGDVLTGKTYPIKEYIKAYLGGKWTGGAWKVDVSKVQSLIDRKAIVIDDTPDTAKSTTGNGQWYHYTPAGERELNSDY